MIRSFLPDVLLDYFSNYFGVLGHFVKINVRYRKGGHSYCELMHAVADPARNLRGMRPNFDGAEKRQICRLRRPPETVYVLSFYQNRLRMQKG